MRSESHHAPSRDLSTGSGRLQLTRSSERDSRISPRPPSNCVLGRWNITHRPSIRWGRRAAFLSSGCVIMPIRSTVVKSSVVAR
jgi:hypothetical protein